VQIVFWISFGLLWCIVAIQGFVLLEVLRQIGQIRKPIEHGEGSLLVHNAELTGQRLPEASGRRASDLLPANWDDYLGTGLGVIVLLSTRCIACRTVAEQLNRFADEAKGRLSLVVLIEGTSEEVQLFLSETHLNRQRVIIDEEGTIARRLGVKWNPGVVTIRERKIDQLGLINDVDQLNILLQTMEEAHVTT
jgi:hypothetical protein